MKRTPLTRKTPLTRSKALTGGRLRRVKALQTSRRVSAAERRAYAEATDRARDVEGYLVCEGCGHSIRDGDEERHHRTFRSQGGATTPGNLAVLCGACHDSRHGIRRVSYSLDTLNARNGGR